MRNCGLINTILGENFSPTAAKKMPCVELGKRFLYVNNATNSDLRARPKHPSTIHLILFLNATCSTLASDWI